VSEVTASPASPATEPANWLRGLLPVAACVLLVSALAHVRVPLLPSIGDDLSMPHSQLGLAVTLFGLGRLAMDLPAGRLADRFRPMRLMATSALAMALGSAALAASTVPGMVMGSFLLLGAASATANTTGMTSLTGAAPPHRRGAAMAMYSGCLLTGQAVGPAVSGVIADLDGWRTAAAVGAGMGIVVAVLGFSWRPRRQGGRGSSDRAISDGGPPLTTVQRAVAYGVGFGVFFTVGAMPQTLLPLIGAGELGLSVSAIGLAIGFGGLARVVGAVVTGAVSDGISRRAALLPCLALQLVGVLVLAVDGGTPWWLAAIVLMSLGASAHAVAATVLADRVNPAQLGRSLGRYRFAADLGLVAGPVLSATVYEVAGRTASVGAVALVLLVGTVAAAAALPETGPRARRAA
jgi:DHA1 family multidrug resistance protein-like MFS transporter